MNRIDTAFRKAKAAGRTVFIPYLMAGDPSLDLTMERILMLEQCGADIVELGVPHSDPVADGPTIQRAAERALASKTTLRRLIPFVAEVRARTQVPLIFMTYYNPIIKYGTAAFVADAAAAGVDGLIIPDLPPEEAKDLIARCRKAGINTIFLVAPTSTDERMAKIVKASRGFIYYVSMTGITGSKLTLDPSFAGHLAKLRGMTPTPVCIGFGIATPDDARSMAAAADGVIVGSALVRRFHEAPETAREFVAGLRAAI